MIKSFSKKKDKPDNVTFDFSFMDVPAGTASIFIDESTLIGGSVWPGYRLLMGRDRNPFVISPLSSSIECDYCHVKNDAFRGCCEHCGAPL